MRRSAVVLAIASTLAIVMASSAPQAQMGFPSAPGGMTPSLPGGGGGGMGCSATDSLKSWLAITEVQKSVWDAYATALKNNLAGLHGVKESVATVMSGKTPIEQLDAHATAAESRLKALREIKPSLAALYSALSTDQKKKADQILGLCMV